MISFLSFLDSSMAEHTAVNRGVVGSSPTRGVKLERVRNRIRLLGQAVKTSPFHGGNTGSIPVGVTKERLITGSLSIFLVSRKDGPMRTYGPLAQLVRATGS